LHAFAVLAEELHFGRAAVRLGIAQPPLSQQIQRLEQRVGHRLLIRGGTARLALTPAGREMLIAARRALDGLDAGLEAARRAASGETGIVRVGFTPSLALTYLPPLVRNFRTRFPGVDLQLSEQTSAAQVESIRARRLDVGFLREPPEAADLSSHAVAHENLVVLLPRTHSLAAAKRIALTALAAEPFGAGFEPVVAQEVGEWSTVAGLVSAGVGVALAPASVARIKLPGMVHRPLTAAARSRIMLFWRLGETNTVVANFVALATAAVPGAA
jgi:DNA-binding transcriptional LysR family regulator